MNLHSYLHPNEPEQESIKLSPETMKMLMDEASPTVSILKTINRLSNKIDENQQKAEEQMIKQQLIETKRFYINLTIATIAAIAAILGFIVPLLFS